MSIDPKLIQLAERLIATKRHERNAALQDDLRRRQGEAAGRGILGAGFYASAQMDACARELNARADAIWAAYQRVISDARIPWSTEVRDCIIQRVKSETEADIGYLEEMARNVIVRHGHGFELFLRNAWPGILARIEAEVDLFGIKQHPVSTTLSDQLSSPRYAGPGHHWFLAQAARVADPPDLVAAAREAIHTMEGLTKVLTGQATATCGDCIKTLKARNVIPGAAAKLMEILWGYSSNLESVRHGSSTGEIPRAAELLFIVQSAEAASNFLLSLDRPAD